MNKLIPALVIGLIIAMLINIGVDYNDCNGNFVRGLFWFECM